MSHRIPLRPLSTLCFSSRSGGAVTYTVIREIGRGGSCIVYEVSFAAGEGSSALYRIKECYPHFLDITRNADNSLCCAKSDSETFERLQEKMCEDFSRTNSLIYSDDNYDNIPNAFDIYRANGTVYTVSAFSSEKTLASFKPASVKECVSLVRKTACILEKLHGCGYLYLDLKPDNVLVADGVEKRVQLFDLDSLLPVSSIKEMQGKSVRLSYSRGFAPVELTLSQLNKLGFHSDIFEVGALLFYLLYGNTPRAADCDSDAVFGVSGMKYHCSGCDDKLFSALTEFFRKTLANYYKDRYSDMNAVVEKLCEIERLADPAVPRLFSSRIIRQRNFVGRNAELCEIEKRLKESNCLFITGEGGIGKSALVREYLSRSDYDISLYMRFEGSIGKTLSSDDNISISTLHRSDELCSNERYFTRKLRKIRELIRGRTAVIVIDDFCGEIDEDLRAVLETEWKVIVVARKAPAYANCNALHISAIGDKNALLRLFENNLRRRIADNEQHYFDEITAGTGWNTLAPELIAKQIASSRISLENAVSLTEDSTTAGNVIDKLLCAACLSGKEKTLLKTASLLGVNGIDIIQFCEICGAYSSDGINELLREGLLTMNGDTLSMHPLIREAVRRAGWSEELLCAADSLLGHFYIKIRLLSTKNNFPNALREKCIRYMRLRQDSSLPKNALKERLLEERLKSFDDHSPADTKRLFSLVLRAEEILENVGREPVVKRRELYYKLLCETVLNMPLYRGERILERAGEIFRSKRADPLTIMRLFAKAALVYRDRGRFKDAKSVISKARRFAKKARDSRAYAVYCDMAAAYYDDLICGHYDTEEPREIALRRRSLKYIDLTIRYAKEYKEYDPYHLYIKSLLAKAAVLLRGRLAAKGKVFAFLETAREEIAKNAPEYADVRLRYNLVCAGFYAACNDPEKAHGFIEAACTLSELILPTDLEKIDLVLIPCADIYFELREYDRAQQLLKQALQKCDGHEGAGAYERKRTEVRRRLREAAEAAGDEMLWLIDGYLGRTDSGN